MSFVRNMPIWLQAGFWGLVAGSALLIGAFAGYAFSLPRRIIAGVMAFGSGVLISALSFDLMEEAYRRGGFMAAAEGFLIGATVFTAVNLWLAARGAKHRKSSGDKQGKQDEAGLSIALGALLDGIPESLVIGLSLLESKGVSTVAVVAVFLSNLPEGLSSSAGMKRAGRSRLYIFGLWGGIALSSGIAAMAGAALMEGAPANLIASVTATAAGAILAMLADTMIPEAFEEAHDFAGLITVIGFLAAFALSKLGA